ncbi:MAG: metal ABC transporter ATP-binding protein [Clostridiaceae bacterium]|nr:metal ABC transporter ATP-binding protein [Clostridiaceae bacterium]
MNHEAHCITESGRACSGYCCTKIENFGVELGNLKILDNINLHLHCGELTAIIGPNGAGKSTLVKALLGQVPHTGTISFMQANATASKAPVMGYVPQNLNLDPTSPTSVLDLFVAARSSYPVWLLKPRKEVQKVREKLDRVKAGHLVHRKLGALSGGELQRVLLALALDPIPDILLLDEPVSGIDQNGLELFYETVSALRKAFDLSIILVSHDMDMIYKYADRVVLLNRTVLAMGTPEEVFNSESFFEVFSMNWQKRRMKDGN